QPNPAEAFLRLVRRQVLARIPGAEEVRRDNVLECDLYPVLEELPEAASRLRRALARIAEPLAALRGRLLARLEDEAEELDSAIRIRIEAVARSLARRALDRLSAWDAMLRAVGEVPPEPGERPDHVLFLALDRREA